ncbi:NUDIX domain-containing protein [Sulfobacillus harzensis]|uniref:NUDIX domain-containing protein n=1 Tax=Sulfobacillus harzensis TaxID=2729629 RepID=A0A7Y0Q3M1_9FIRM|nr:NUDIX domain-containing protein [Sulfobacillus harzensis]NMP23131.1 NUDIX domain-containing protein [Sulfobacillus harzensis]
MPMSPYYRHLREKIGTMPIFSPSVAAVIRNSKGEILFQRPIGSSEIWSLPAGAIEIGETPVMAVVREVYEETGLEVKPTRVLAVLGGDSFRFTYPDGNQVEYLVVVFQCAIVAGELRGQDGESAELGFFPYHKRPPLALPYPDAIFLTDVGPTWFQP